MARFANAVMPSAASQRWAQTGRPDCRKPWTCLTCALQRFTVGLLQRLGPSARPLLVRLAADPTAAHKVAILQALVEIDAVHRLDWMQRLLADHRGGFAASENDDCDDDVRVF